MIQTKKWNIVLIQKVEIFKMASQMPVSLVPKTFLTNIPNKIIFIFILWMLEVIK